MQTYIGRHIFGSALTVLCTSEVKSFTFSVNSFNFPFTYKCKFLLFQKAIIYKSVRKKYHEIRLLSYEIFKFEDQHNTEHDKLSSILPTYMLILVTTIGMYIVASYNAQKTSGYSVGPKDFQYIFYKHMSFTEKSTNSNTVFIIQNKEYFFYLAHLHDVCLTFEEQTKNVKITNYKGIGNVPGFCTKIFIDS